MHAAIASILEQARGIWRFRWTAMLGAWIVCLIGWLVVLALPDTYSAWTEVHIGARTRLQGISPGSDVVAVAAAVREALLGGPQLDKVARVAMPRYAYASPSQQQGILEGLRKRVKVESNEVGPRNQPADLYTITYTDRDRLTAHRVVEQLLQQFLANIQGDTREAAKQTEQLLQRKIAETKEQLQALDSRLADFKKQNAGVMPETTGGYTERLQAEKDQLAKMTDALQVAEQKAQALRLQLLGEALVDTTAEIRASEAQLRELRLRFTDQYPDVIAAQSRLEELKARRQAETAATVGDAASTSAVCRGASPVQQGICSQLSQAEVEVSASKRQVDIQGAKIADLNKMIERAPQVEKEYAQLNRDHESTLNEYNRLVEQLNRATLEDQAETTAAITIVEPPTGSAMPVSPDRQRLILVVLLAGLAVGVGMAYFMNELRPVFYSARQLGEFTELPVIGIVDGMRMEQRMAQELRALWAYCGATAALVLAAVITLLAQSTTSHFIHQLMA
jgi:polysaccharide chain length determinant protein (PEP-CTERM system associated)